MTLFAALARTSAAVAADASRLAKIRLLAEFLRGLEPDEIAIAISFLSGETRQGKLAIGWDGLRSARGAPAPAPGLELRDVDAAFAGLKALTGKGSATRRREALKSLFDKATTEEAEFLGRLILGELRQGALEGVLMDAVAAAANAAPADVRRAATFAGGLAAVASAALTGGSSMLSRFTVRLMQPVLPMLAQPAQDVAEGMSALHQAIVEWKLDGARIQVHKAGDEVRVFTRNLNDVTVAVPEVVAAARASAARSLILDGEAIALRADGRPHPFQITMRRFGRKLDVAALQRELPLSAFFFDCLLIDHEPLVDRSNSERRAALHSALPESLVTPSLVADDLPRVEAFYVDALARGHEGVMLKAIQAPYEAGRRGGAWLKVKRAHTLDLVVLAAEWGSGRRRGWLSNLHLGARDAERRGFVMLGKTFKGMSDEMLAWQTREFLARETRRDEWTVHVRPELVVEVAFNDVQESPQYPSGLALRFARVKGYRPDKRADEADTIETVRRIYEESLS